MLCSLFQCNTRRFVSFVALKAIDQKFLSKSTENVLLQKPLARFWSSTKCCLRSLAGENSRLTGHRVTKALSVSGSKFGCR